MVATHILPPPVKPIEQDTEFAIGDTLLITEAGKDEVVTVGRVSVADHKHINPKAPRSVLYTIRFHEVRAPFLSCSRVISELALLKLDPHHVAVNEAVR